MGAEKYRIPLDPEALTPASSDQFLGSIHGTLKTLKAIQSKKKPKSTLAIEVRGERGASNSISQTCGDAMLRIKGIGYPYASLALAFPSEGRFPSDGQVRKKARACMTVWVPGIKTSTIRVKKARIFRQGSEIARLYLISFLEPRNTHFDIPR